MNDKIDIAIDDLDTIKQLDLIWGAEGIGIVIGRNPRQTFYLLEHGHIPTAQKIGGRWVVERGRLREFFLEGGE